MKELALALIKDTSVAFAFMVLFVCSVPIVAMIVRAVQRANDLTHEERMTNLADDHRENMLRINRDNPKVIENKK